MKLLLGFALFDLMKLYPCYTADDRLTRLPFMIQARLLQATLARKVSLKKLGLGATWQCLFFAPLLKS